MAGVVAQVQGLAAKPGHQKGIGGLAGAHALLAPGAAPALGPAKLPQVVGLAEPEVGLRLADKGVAVVQGRGLVAGHHQQAAPGAVVANDAQVGADRAQAPDFAAVLHGGQLVKHAAGIDQPALGLDLADARPLGGPRVVLGVGALGQAVGGPPAVDADLEDGGGIVGADGIDRVVDRGAAGDGVKLAGLEGGPAARRPTRRGGPGWGRRGSRARCRCCWRRRSGPGRCRRP